jgi:hypothetical protein
MRGGAGQCAVAFRIGSAKKVKDDQLKAEIAAAYHSSWNGRAQEV